MNIITKCLQGSPPLLKVCTNPLTEGNNRNFARGSRTDLYFILFYFLYLVNVVSVPLTEDKNQIFKGVLPPSSLFFGDFFGQQDQVATIQAGMWIYFHSSEFLSIIIFSPNPISIKKLWNIP